MGTKKDSVTEQLETHPSYGMISVSRQTHSGDAVLFGSNVGVPTTLSVRISPARVSHDLGRDQYYSTLNPLIEIRMTPSQWAEFVSSIGIGMGSPCTIAHFNGESVPTPPPVKRETERIVDSFKTRTEDLVARSRLLLAEVESILGKKSLTNADRKKLTDIFHAQLNHLQGSAPFMLNSFTEATDRIGKAVQRDLDAFVQDLGRRHGVPNLAQDALLLEEKKK